jgi:4'-phosphopantetheinyl transferase
MYMELLSPSERKNALSMNGEKLQKGAVLSRALVRTTLSRCKKTNLSYKCSNLEIGEWAFTWKFWAYLLL